MNKLANFSLGLLAVFLIVYTLIVAQSFFLPLLIAIVIGYFIISVVEGIQHVSFRGRRPHPILASVLALIAFSAVGIIIYSVLSTSFANVLQVAPLYQEKLQNLQKTFVWLQLPLTDLSKIFKHVDIVTIVSKVVSMLTQVASNAGIIAVYVLFLLIEYQFMDQKFVALMPFFKGHDTTKQICTKISKQIQSYLKLKSLLSLVTAFASYFVFLLVGVDFPDFWAFLIFLLNYIPTVGAIISTLFPIALTLIQFDSLQPFIIVSISLILINFVIGSIIEPRLMGKQFNLSGFVIILSLAIWGQIWGIVGLFLAVPLVMITSIILANFPSTRPIAILLSQDGQLD